MTWLAIFLGGGLGSLARFGISKLTLTLVSTTFPLGTLLANFFSCVVMGMALLFFASKMENESVKAFWIIGFCGGFSTFSTFSLETLNLIKQGAYSYAIANVLVSVIVCLLVLYFFLKTKTA